MATSRRKPVRRCPICNKPAAAGPFCSPRCADADLAKWLGEAYRVPTDEPATGLDDGLGEAPGGDMVGGGDMDRDGDGGPE